MMLLRCCLAAVATAALAVQSGCCHDSPWPCGRTYCGTQCGCFYWHEWFSHKPNCCEPCDSCGNYTASKNPYVVTGPPYTRFGPVYSDGSGSNAPGAMGEMYSTPAGPTPARAPAPRQEVFDDAGPYEELPGPTTSVPGGHGRTASRGGFDSPYPSRTLGRPQRARLFAR